jgi:hypothetical protein
LQRLNNNGRSTTTSVANSGAADLAVLLLEHTEEGGCYPGTGSTERVAKCNSTTVDVDLVFADTQNLHVRKRDNTEGLVDLESVNSGLLDLGVLQSLGHSEGGRGGELGRVLLSISPSKNLANRLEVVLLDSSLRRKDESSGAIGEWRGVGRGDGSLLLEGGADSACLGLVELG